MILNPIRADMQLHVLFSSMHVLPLFTTVFNQSHYNVLSYSTFIIDFRETTELVRKLCQRLFV